MGISVWQLIIVLLMFTVVVLPWVMAFASGKVGGSKKLVWFLLAFFFSWIGYLIYYYAVVRGLSQQEANFVPHSDNPNRQAPY